MRSGGWWCSLGGNFGAMLIAKFARLVNFNEWLCAFDVIKRQRFSNTYLYIRKISFYCSQEKRSR